MHVQIFKLPIWYMWCGYACFWVQLHHHFFLLYQKVFFYVVERPPLIFLLWAVVFNTSLIGRESSSLEFSRIVIDRVIRCKGVCTVSIFISTISIDFEASPPLIPSLEAHGRLCVGITTLQQSTSFAGRHYNKNCKRCERPYCMLQTSMLP